MTTTTLTRDTVTSDRQFAVEVRAKDDTGRSFTGIGVPYGEEIDLWGIRERFEPGSVGLNPDGVPSLVLWQHRHDEPIGRITAGRDTDAGFEIEGALSDTERGREVATLLRDGVISRLSIGFRPEEYRIEADDDGDAETVVHTRVRAHEFSLVSFPAYTTATVTKVRHRTDRPATPDQEDSMPPETDTLTRDDLDALSETVTDKLSDIERRFAEFTPGAGADELEARAAEFDSLGDWIQAITNERSSRHEDAMILHRDLTTSDVPSKLVNKPGFIGDLTKRITERRRWMNKFRSRPMPSKGMTVDYIKTIVTATVAEQTEELEALAKGSGFSVTPASSPVRTFGGAETVSRQVIDRSEAWALSGMFEAFGLQYGRETEAATKAYIVEKIDEIRAGGVADTTVDVPADFGALDWIDAIVDSAGLFEDLGYLINELAVSADVFKRLAASAGTDGRPLLTVSGTGTNVVGTMDLPVASGELMRVPVSTLHNAAEGTAAFIDPVAIETLESPGAPFWLQEDGVLNLSRDYATYGYLAHINPHPRALLPVNFTSAAGGEG